MKYSDVELLGGGIIKSKTLDIDYEDDDDYKWSDGEREKELAKAISRKTGIPAKYLNLEFHSYYDENACWNNCWNEEHWISNWIGDVPVRALVSVEYGSKEYLFKVLDEDIFKMKTDTDTADFVLKTSNGTKVFPVHKAILTSRSKVFRAMFTSNMADVSAGETIIQDLDEDTLEELIHFLYSGGLSGSQYDIISLCYAANKYELASLMELVRLHLMSAELDVSKLAEVFIASDMFNQEGLFEVAQDKLTEWMWEETMSGKDVLEKGVMVKEVLEKIKNRPELTNKILMHQNAYE